jgi:hypothetical protein
MPPKCGSSSRPRPRAHSFARMALFALALGGCSRMEAEVGAGFPPSSDAGGDAGFTLFTDFGSNDGLWGMRNGGAAFGVADPGAGDGKVAELRFPGMPGLTAADRVGPFFATEIPSTTLLHFGTYRTGLSVPSCPADQDVVNAMFVFFNDGSDANHNGIVDNDEIDVQFLCSAPSIMYLTVWTDYEENDAGIPQRFIRLRRIVDFATGDVYDSVSDASDGYTKTATEPMFARPGFPAASTFYEMGFDWRADSVRFFIVLGGAELTLWTLADAAHVPQRAASIMYNMWHPSEHWHPRSGPALYPAQDVTLHVDWFGYRAD